MQYIVRTRVRSRCKRPYFPPALSPGDKTYGQIIDQADNCHRQKKSHRDVSMYVESRSTNIGYIDTRPITAQWMQDIRGIMSLNVVNLNFRSDIHCWRDAFHNDFAPFIHLAGTRRCQIQQRNPVQVDRRLQQR